MKIICVTVCDNCGKNLVNDPNNVSIFVADDEITGVSQCPKCKDFLAVILSKETARTIAHKGVKVFSWRTAEQISPENIK